MPFKIFQQDNEFCVFKVDAEGGQEGSSRGCHPTREAAEKQLAALNINVRECIIQEAALSAPEGELTGREWEVTLIGADPKRPDSLVDVGGEQFIKSKNGRLWNVGWLKNNIHIWENVRVFDNHQPQDEFERTGGARSVDKDWLGKIVGVRWDELMPSRVFSRSPVRPPPNC
jgi:hypothetical protein